MSISVVWDFAVIQRYKDYSEGSRGESRRGNLLHFLLGCEHDTKKHRSSQSESTPRSQSSVLLSNWYSAAAFSSQLCYTKRHGREWSYLHKQTGQNWFLRHNRGHGRQRPQLERKVSGSLLGILWCGANKMFPTTTWSYCEAATDISHADVN